ncbi:MAG: PD40 domain-containing protein [Gemmatimonadetes bacterium]|nr:PD40 domain-containing protein [Gemmatimonadota bacterium]
MTVRSMGGPATELPVLVTAEVLVGSSRSGRFGLYALSSADPSGFWPVLTDSVANYLDAAYSPDRSRLAFVSDKFGNYDIFVADADGQNAGPRHRRPGGGFPAHLVARRQVPGLHLGPGRHPPAPRGGRGRLGEPPAHQLPRRRRGTGDLARRRHGGVHRLPRRPRRQGRHLRHPLRRRRGAPGERQPRPARVAARLPPHGRAHLAAAPQQPRRPDQVLKQPAAGGLPVPLLTSPLPIGEYAIARDGARLAWVTSGRPPEITFQWRTLGPGTEVRVRLAPGERITSPAF